MRVFLSIGLAGLLALACSSSVSYVKLGKEYAPLALDQEVKVFIEKPKQEYDKVALVAVEGGNLEERVNAAKARARQVGATGVIMLDELERTDTRVESVTRHGRLDKNGSEKFRFTETRPEQRIVRYIEHRFLLIRLK